MDVSTANIDSLKGMPRVDAITKRANRLAALRRVPRVPGQSLDEYPFGFIRGGRCGCPRATCARGVFTVDGRGYLSMDQGEFEALGAEMNPEADAWQPLES